MANTDSDLQDLQIQLEKRAPHSQWQVVTVTFPAIADTDMDIRHNLTVQDPERIDYAVQRASGPAFVYHDTSASRTKWQKGVIRLRSKVAGLKADIMLTVSADETRKQFDGGGKTLTLTKADLPASIAYEDEANVFTLDQLISKTRPDVQLLAAGSTTKCHILAPVPDALHITHNATYDGSNWNLDDTSKAGSIYTQGTGAHGWYTISAGANPRSPTAIGSLDTIGTAVFFVLSLTGGQITFPASQNASGGANVLDDYEEGTWTPVDASGAGISLTNEITGQYVKIGQLVVATWGVAYPGGIVSGVGAAVSLPFTPQGTQYDGGVFYNTVVGGLTAIVNAGAANMSIFDGSVQKSNASLSNAHVRGTAVYRASA